MHKIRECKLKEKVVQKKLKCPSTDEWRKMWCVYIYIYICTYAHTSLWLKMEKLHTVGKNRTRS